MAQPPRARSYLLTINNPPGNDLPQHPTEKYAVWQLEKGESGTPHLQAYVQMRNPIAFKTMKALYPTAHIEVARSCVAAMNYCKKVDSRQEGPWERGDPPSQGHRSDLDAIANLIATEGIEAAIQQYPGHYIQHHKGMHKYAEAVKPRPRDTDFVPRPWQQDILDIIEAPVHDRKIYWIKDTRGNRGKSRLITHILKEQNGIELRGKIADMSFMYNGEKVACFDISRTQAEHMDHLYDFAEQLKNGRVVSTKYESSCKMFETPHVFFFSNSMPDMEKWSRDRYHIIDLDEIFKSQGKIYNYATASSSSGDESEAQTSGIQHEYVEAGRPYGQCRPNRGRIRQARSKRL